MARFPSPSPVGLHPRFLPDFYYLSGAFCTFMILPPSLALSSRLNFNRTANTTLKSSLRLSLCIYIIPSMPIFLCINKSLSEQEEKSGFFCCDGRSCRRHCDLQCAYIDFHFPSGSNEPSKPHPSPPRCRMGMYFWKGSPASCVPGILVHSFHGDWQGAAVTGSVCNRDRGRQCTESLGGQAVDECGKRKSVVSHMAGRWERRHPASYLHQFGDDI